MTAFRDVKAVYVLSLKPRRSFGSHPPRTNVAAITSTWLGKITWSTHFYPCPNGHDDESPEQDGELHANRRGNPGGILVGVPQDEAGRELDNDKIKHSQWSPGQDFPHTAWLLAAFECKLEHRSRGNGRDRGYRGANKQPSRYLRAYPHVFGLEHAEDHGCQRHDSQRSGKSIEVVVILQQSMEDNSRAQARWLIG